MLLPPHWNLPKHHCPAALPKVLPGVENKEDGTKMDARVRGILAAITKPNARVGQSGLELTTDSHGTQGSDTSSNGTNLTRTLATIYGTAPRARAASTVAPLPGARQHLGMRSLGMALRQQPRPGKKPSQDCLQVVQARIDNQPEHNCPGNNNHGTPRYRTLHHQCHSRQWPFRSAPTQRHHAPPVPLRSKASSQCEFTKAGQGCSLGHPPHEERVLRASSEDFARKRAPQPDWRRKYSLETTSTHLCTRWSRSQPPPRKLRAIPGTNPSIRRNTVFTNRIWGLATGWRAPTKRVTTTVGKPQLMDQMRAGAVHQEAVYQTKIKTKEGQKTPREKTITLEECIPISFLFYYMKVPH